MDIVIFGLNHKTADLDHREAVSKKLRTKEARQRFISGLLSIHSSVAAHSLIKEITVISTCNRAEFVMIIHESEAENINPIKLIENYILNYFFGDGAGNDAGLYNMFYTFKNKEAISHLFAVTSSLDSMIIGEPQILGQVKNAYNEACDLKTAGPLLNKLFHRSFYCAKKIRTETKIASAPVSVSYAAVEIAKKIFNSIDDKKVLLMGVGEMGKVAAKHFIKHGVTEIFITNRTNDKAAEFAKEIFGYYGKGVIDFAEYYKILTVADIVLCSMGAENFIIKYDDLLPIIKLRKQKPLFLIDISVPRNIDPEVNKISNVYLFDIDDIGKMVENNLDVRQKEAGVASQIVESEAEEFIAWKSSLNAVPIIVALKNRIQNILNEELGKYLNKNSDDIRTLINSIANKILHDPVKVIKKNALDDNGINLMEAAKTLFNLEQDINEKDETKKDETTRKNSNRDEKSLKIKLIK